MALIFFGQTNCAICGNILTENDEFVGLPAFADSDSSLYPFSDAAFHKSCYDNWGKRQEVESVIEERRKELLQSDQYKHFEAKYGKPKWLSD